MLIHQKQHGTQDVQRLALKPYPILSDPTGFIYNLLSDTHEQLFPIRILENGLKTLLNEAPILEVLEKLFEIHGVALDTLEESIESGQEIRVCLFQIRVQQLKGLIVTNPMFQGLGGLEILEIPRDQLAVFRLLGFTRISLGHIH